MVLSNRPNFKILSTEKICEISKNLIKCCYYLLIISIKEDSTHAEDNRHWAILDTSHDTWHHIRCIVSPAAPDPRACLRIHSNKLDQKRSILENYGVYHWKSGRARLVRSSCRHVVSINRKLDKTYNYLSLDVLFKWPFSKACALGWLACVKAYNSCLCAFLIEVIQSPITSEP